MPFTNLNNCYYFLSAGQAIHLSDLQKYLSTLTAPPEEGGPSTGSAGGPENVDLASVISGVDVIATAKPHAADLKEHLPQPAPDQQQDDIETTLLSPQFSQVTNNMKLIKDNCLKRTSMYVFIVWIGVK